MFLDLPFFSGALERDSIFKVDQSGIDLNEFLRLENDCGHQISLAKHLDNIKNKSKL